MNKTQRTYWLELVLDKMLSKSVVIVQGLRCIGKTVLLETVKTNDRFTNHKILPIKIGVFGQNDKEIFEGYIKTIKNNPNNMYLMTVDEFQDFDEWDSLFTTLYDFENLKVIATGSISALSSTGAKITQGGRYVYVNMPPLSFSEFKMIKPEAKVMDDNEIFADFSTYGSYPYMGHAGNISGYKEFVSENIVEKIKNQEFLKRFDLSSIKSVITVLLYIVENPGGRFSRNNVSTKLGIDGRTMVKILDYLKQMFIIYEINNISQSKGKAAADNVKYYLVDHTFFLFNKSLPFKDLDTNYKSAVFENIIINSVRMKLSRYGVDVKYMIDNKENINLDMVTQRRGKTTYFEIKDSKSQSSLTLGQGKFLSENNGSVVYRGGTKKENNIQWINYIEFIEEVEKWI